MYIYIYILYLICRSGLVIKYHLYDKCMHAWYIKHVFAIPWSTYSGSSWHDDVPPRLCQSRSYCGSFYVKDVQKETIQEVMNATGITDLQAWGGDRLTYHMYRIVCVCVCGMYHMCTNHQSCIHDIVHACMHACIYAKFTHASYEILHACMHACMCIVYCMHAWMHACMCIVHVCMVYVVGFQQSTNVPNTCMSTFDPFTISVWVHATHFDPVDCIYMTSEYEIHEVFWY